MKASELRIGNIVNVRYDRDFEYKPCLVDSIIKYGINYSSGEFDYTFYNIEPIKLTKEWLIKLGFKIEFYGGQGNSGTTATIDSKISNVYNIDFEIYQYSESKGEWDFLLCSRFKTPINYVHELQNLYFSLLGKELECDGF